MHLSEVLIGTIHPFDAYPKQKAALLTSFINRTSHAVDPNPATNENRFNDFARHSHHSVERLQTSLKIRPTRPFCHETAAGPGVGATTLGIIHLLEPLALETSKSNQAEGSSGCLSSNSRGSEDGMNSPPPSRARLTILETGTV